MRDGGPPVSADAALQVAHERNAQRFWHSLQMALPTPSPLDGGLRQWLGSAAQVVDHRAGGVERVAVVLERAAMPSLTLGNGLFELRKVLLSKLDKRTPGLDQQTRRDLRRGASARAGSVPQRLRRSLVATELRAPGTEWHLAPQGAELTLDQVVVSRLEVPPEHQEVQEWPLAAARRQAHLQWLIRPFLRFGPAREERTCSLQEGFVRTAARRGAGDVRLQQAGCVRNASVGGCGRHRRQRAGEQVRDGCRRLRNRRDRDPLAPEGPRGRLRLRLALCRRCAAVRADGRLARRTSHGGSGRWCAARRASAALRGADLWLPRRPLACRFQDVRRADRSEPNRRPTGPSEPAAPCRPCQ